ncbi:MULTISPECIES: glutathionylspermidine synthase family protein [Paraburkholderia]|uniref:glutathionylspermidine synthase family protein n=1 Tax=Paraburkholderia TaxID=1822464 RepID=UPI0022536142|nr:MULTISPECIES: glutathionylspermidine synthase family protein [Paraburkholderia]MCX4165034.1 glutathionylspermidine synthase family protein [Paraburkholderia megapolitana]MDN7160527.1 glutathionylspermidine synthase family protein [Paraburkholderia sp. CHISQ3]MDQ6497574.1 glutathionylspermidine synthase family protein [Paraburkholderia megapolitana]
MSTVNLYDPAQDTDDLGLDHTILKDRLARLTADERREVAAAQARLSQSVWDAGLNFEGKPYPVSLRPLPIAQKLSDSLADTAERFVKVFDTVARLYCSEPHVRDLFPAYRNMERYTVALPNMTPLVRICRLDGLFAPDGRYQVLETNTDCPGGVIQNGLAGQIWAKADNPLIEGLDLSADSQPFVRDPDSFLKELLAAHLERTGNAAQSAAVVTFKGRFTNEVERMVSGLNRLGVEAWTVDAAELKRSNGRLVDARGRAIDLAYNKLDLRDLIDDPQVEDYLQATADGEVTFLNPLICQWPLADKAILALLSDPQYGHLFSAQERELCAKHIPWTRLLRSETLSTGINGETTDLLSYAIRNRKTLILKPTNATRGEGVLIGHTVDQNAWEAALALALRGGPHVIQQYIQAAQIAAPHPISGEIQQMCSGVDVYVYGGRFAGFQARASLDPIMNVGKRGILLPVATYQE